MVKVGFNYGNKDKCPLCKIADDDQQHLFRCPELTNDNDNNAQYTEMILDSDNTNTNWDWDIISLTIKRLEKAIRRREVIIEGGHD